MERIQGQTLPEAWVTLSDSDCDEVYAQLKSFLQELRKLPPPSHNKIESCVGGSLRDSRIPHSRPRFGPFGTIQEFHLWLREELRPEEHPDRKADEDWSDIKEMVKMQDGTWPRPVFTHGDLNPFNIMVKGKQVVGIIDWEFSGWYPSYWEYTSAWCGSLTRQSWQAVLTKLMDPYPRELKMERTRQRWWGDL
jgi:aminoglycoside phosphotransferase (APT) family kinase protein